MWDTCTCTCTLFYLTFPVVCPCNPNICLNSSSDIALGTSILLPEVIYMYTIIYMKIHEPSMLAIGVDKHTQQTNKQPQWLIKFIKHSHKGLENIRAATLA